MAKVDQYVTIQFVLNPYDLPDVPQAVYDEIDRLKGAGIEARPQFVFKGTGAWYAKVVE